MSTARRRILAAATASTVGLAMASAATPAQAASATVVVSEAYGGGGNSGATYTHDFVELHNLSASPVDLSGYTVRYYSSGGNLGGSCALTGTIAPGGYFLVQEGKGSGGTTALPTPDATCGAAMSATTGSVEVRDAAADAVVDLVGYGSSSNAGFTFETAPAPAPSSSTSVARKDVGVDTDNNSADFAVGDPAPQNSGSPTTPPPARAATIAEIQGTGSASPMAGAAVRTTGVVTAAYPTGGFNGVYVQTPGSGGATDATPGASDGIFVYSTWAAANLQVGDCVNVEGTVKEYSGLTELEKAFATKVQGCEPVAPTPLTRLPATDADKEQLEGMLLAPQGTYTVTNNYQLNQYGQLGLAVGTRPLRQATDAVLPGAAATAYEAANLRRLVTLDDGSSWDYLRTKAAQSSPLPYLSQAEPMRTGSHVTFTKPVILDYRFQWNYQPTGQVVGATDADDPVASENDRPATAPAVGGELRVATFNVLNYFTDLGEAEDRVKGCSSYKDRDGVPVATNGCEVRGAWTGAAFADQQSKIVAAINGLHADVVSLEEIETSSAISYLTGQSRDKALASLVEALNAAGGSWAYAPSPVGVPSNEDVIRTAFIYNPARVQLLGPSQILLDEAFANARYPLAQKFKARRAGAPFVVVANHFKSKGSGEDDGTGQGLSNPARVAQAKAVTSWVAKVFATEAVFLVGDFNAYSMEDPVRTIEARGYLNLAKVLDPCSASYQFSGRLGSLDHAFANRAALRLVTGARVWDVNADESVAMQYSRRNYNVVDFFAPTPYAASDHDPLVIGVRAKVGRG